MSNQTDDLDRKEMQLLRELAAGQCTTSKVIAELGPVSLWSKAGFEREMARVRAEAAIGGQWIAVTERLPEMGVPVFGFDGKYIGFYVRDWIDEGWNWCSAYGSTHHTSTGWECEGEFDDEYVVTHWLALPLPPTDLGHPTESDSQAPGAVDGDRA